MSEQSFWYELKLGEYYGLTTHVGVRRVPGGWIYSTPVADTFIPYNNEFQLK